jgi:hypothetical protein
MQFTISLLLVLISQNSFAVGKIPFGKVEYIHGSAKVSGNALNQGDKVFIGDEISTSEKSFVRVLLAGSTAAFQLGASSTAKLLIEDKKTNTVDLLKGFILSTVKPQSPPPEQESYRVKSKGVAMGVRGTTFFAKLNSDGSTFQCICEGHVDSSWKSGQESVVSKHHDRHQVIFPGEKDPRPMAMGDEHSDAEVAELKQLLKL